MEIPFKRAYCPVVICPYLCSSHDLLLLQLREHPGDVPGDLAPLVGDASVVLHLEPERLREQGGVLRESVRGLDGLGQERLHLLEDREALLRHLLVLLGDLGLLAPQVLELELQRLPGAVELVRLRDVLLVLRVQLREQLGLLLHLRLYGRGPGGLRARLLAGRELLLDVVRVVEPLVELGLELLGRGVPPRQGLAVGQLHLGPQGRAPQARVQRPDLAEHREHAALQGRQLALPPRDWLLCYNAVIVQ